MYYLLHSYKRVRVNTIDYDRSCANVTLHVLLNLQRNRYSQKGNVEVVALTLKLHPDAAITPATARRHTIPCMGYYATLLSARKIKMPVSLILLLLPAALSFHFFGYFILFAVTFG